MLQRLQANRPPQPAPEPLEAFRDGRAALGIGGTEWVARLQDDTSPVRGRFGVCRVPGSHRVFAYQTGELQPVEGVNAVPYLGTGGWLGVVPRGAAHPEAAFALLAELSGPQVSTEIVLDQGIGDIFSARIAGNVLNDDILGSMEFACKVSGAKLIAVIGHSNCGAIKGAIDDVQLGNLTGLLTKIKPALDAVPASVTPRTSKNSVFVDDVAEASVHLVMQQIRDRSPVLREMLDKHQIGLVGGMYDLSTGQVRFFEK